MKHIISYNVNGIRAAAKKGFWDWVQQIQPDVICLQESKAQTNDLDISFLQPPGYFAYYHSAEKKGYSGVVLMSKQKPLHVEIGCGISEYDNEGRFIRADFENFSVLSVYLPSGTSGEQRQHFKEELLVRILPYFQSLRAQFPNLVICGDFNIAHNDVDIHNPKGNQKTSGFLPQERNWMTDLFANGFADAFRVANPDLQKYSWWSQRFNSRAQNKGWRIDYTIVSENLTTKIIAADCLNEVHHSDHCPIELKLDL